MVKILEENLQTFALVRVTFGTATFTKNCSFGVLSLALTFFDNEDDYNDELFLWYGCPTKSVLCLYHEFTLRCEQDLNLCRTRVQAYLNEAMEQ